MGIRITTGDITKVVNVDAIVTLVNPDGLWYGGVDGAIQRTAGDLYHAQAGRILDNHGLRDGQVIVAQGTRQEHNGRLSPGSYDNVIFVVDALKSPLSTLVAAALQTAHEYGYKSVALPLMRTGIMAGLVEPNDITAIDEMWVGIEPYKNGHMDIWVVAYNDPNLAGYLARKVLGL
jgi:O-acetyl-ADP-ribose deacetylase (regulator of RNase III)